MAGRYRLAEPLGRGGFSEVFQAFDTKLDRDVALKILRSLPSRDLPTLSDEQASRFLREARMIARLDHPHIVPVYDAGVENGVPWIAMKRVLGEPLSQRLKTGPLPPGRAIRLLCQVGDALRHAHQRGITHRDLKPANFLIEVKEDGSDHLWLTDFGIAILRNEVRPEGNLIAGTPGSYVGPGCQGSRRLLPSLPLCVPSSGCSRTFSIWRSGACRCAGARLFPQAPIRASRLRPDHPMPHSLRTILGSA